MKYESAMSVSLSWGTWCPRKLAFLSPFKGMPVTWNGKNQHCDHIDSCLNSGPSKQKSVANWIVGIMLCSLCLFPRVAVLWKGKGLKYDYLFWVQKLRSSKQQEGSSLCQKFLIYCSWETDFLINFTVWSWKNSPCIKRKCVAIYKLQLYEKLNASYNKEMDTMTSTANTLSFIK